MLIVGTFACALERPFRQIWRNIRRLRLGMFTRMVKFQQSWCRTGSSTPHHHRETIRQKYSAKVVIKRRIKRRQQMMRLLEAGDGNKFLILQAIRRLGETQADLEKVHGRSRAISSAWFSLNLLSVEKCLRQLRFKPRYIGSVMQVCGWDSCVTKRNNYRCKPFTSACIFMRKLSYATG